MQIGRYRFAPPWWGIVITVVGVVLLCLLGDWQIHRAHYKERLVAEQAAARAAGPQPMHVTPAGIDAGHGPRSGYRYVVHGHYDAAHQILLANQVEGTQNGVRIWTPLVLDSGATILVDRGWVAGPASPNGPLPDPKAPGGRVTVHGYWRGLPQPGLRFGADAICNKHGWPRALNYPTTATVRCQYRRPVADGLLLLSPADAGGFVRDWDTDRVGLSPFAHYAYASQWFLMAVIAVIIFVVVNARRDTS